MTHGMRRWIVDRRDRMGRVAKAVAKPCRARAVPLLSAWKLANSICSGCCVYVPQGLGRVRGIQRIWILRVVFQSECRFVLTPRSVVQ